MQNDIKIPHNKRTKSLCLSVGQRSLSCQPLEVLAEERRVGEVHLLGDECDGLVGMTQFNLDVKRHGVIAYGPSLDDALFSAVYLEEGAKTYLLAKLIGEVTELPKEEIIRELGGMDHYGQ